MKEALFSLQKRKDNFKKLVDDLDLAIQSNKDHIVQSLLPGEREKGRSIRGLFADRRTLRAISLKMKMILTLLQKAFLLWRDEPSVRNLLRLPEPLENLVLKNPWLPGDALLVKAEALPFIANHYLQPTIRLLDIECDSIETSFAGTRFLAERDLGLMAGLGLSTAPFTCLDSIRFFKDLVIDHFLSHGQSHLPKPSLCFVYDGGEGKKPEYLDSIIAFMENEGFSARALDPRELDGGPAFDLLINTIPLETLSGLLKDGAGFTGYWEKRMVMNSGALPAFARGFFELLTDPRYQAALGQPPLDTIRRMIPWTRILRDGKATSPGGEEVSLPDYVMRARQYLIIRQNYGHPVRPPLYGDASTEQQWENALHESLQFPSKSVVQENMELPEATLPFLREEGLTWDKAAFTIDILLNDRGDIGGIGAKLFCQVGEERGRPAGECPVMIAEPE